MINLYRDARVNLQEDGFRISPYTLVECAVNLLPKENRFRQDAKQNLIPLLWSENKEKTDEMLKLIDKGIEELQVMLGQIGE